MRLPETDEEMWHLGRLGIIIMIVGTIIRCIYDALKDSCQLQRYFVYLDIIKKIKVMYSLNCSYFDKEYDSVNELVNDVISSGMDPNYEITYNGVGTGEECVDFIVEQLIIKNKGYVRENKKAFSRLWI